MFMKLYRQNTKDGINVSAGLKVKVMRKRICGSQLGRVKGFPFRGDGVGQLQGPEPSPPHICPLIMVFSSPIQIWFPAEWSCFIVETVLKYLISFKMCTYSKVACQNQLKLSLGLLDYQIHNLSPTNYKLQIQCSNGCLH